jgi:hypothetical protein
MKRLLLTATFCCGLYIISAAQKTAEPGEVTMAEMTMSSYARDTSASAVILFDRGTCMLTSDAEVVFKRHIRIKFFTADAVDEYVTKKILLHRGSQYISRIRGVSHNLENGKIVQSKLTDEGIFKTKQAKVYDQYTFTLPNARAGSVVEYSYTINYNLAMLPIWTFQHSIPTVLSEFEMFSPSTFALRKQMQGFLTVTDVERNSDGTKEKWIVRDAPAFKLEPYTTTQSDYISNIKFYITEVFIPGFKLFDFKRTWEQIAKGLHDSPDFGYQVAKSGYLSSTVDPLIADAKTPDEKMKRIYDFVKTNISWDQTVDMWPDRPFRKLLEEKKGTAAEINLLLVSMMQKADLESYPVVLSTRDNGRLWPFNPSADQFNTVLCLVKLNNKDILLDGTDPTLPMTALPERYLNGNGLVINGEPEKESASWVPIVALKARTVYNTEMMVDASGEIKSKFSITRDGLYSGSMRKKFTDLGQEKYIESTLSNRQWEIAKSEFKNIDVATSLPSENYELTIRDHVQASGEVMYLNPYLDGRIEENIFKSEKREYPVDFATPFDVFHIAKIKIPEGFKVEELPQQKVMSLPNGCGKFLYNITQFGSDLNFSSQLTISKSMILPEDYPALREFYSQIIAKQAEQIVLKKIN